MTPIPVNQLLDERIDLAGIFAMVATDHHQLIAGFRIQYRESGNIHTLDTGSAAIALWCRASARGGYLIVLPGWVKHTESGRIDAIAAAGGVEQEQSADEHNGADQHQNKKHPRDWFKELVQELGSFFRTGDHHPQNFSFDL